MKESFHELAGEITGSIKSSFQTGFANLGKTIAKEVTNVIQDNLKDLKENVNQTLDINNKNLFNFLNHNIGTTRSTSLSKYFY